LDNLSIADFGRWAKLGTIIKEQGTEGKLVVSEPSRMLCAALQCASFQELISCVGKFPHVNVSSETSTSVSFTIEFCNWAKYQGDFSTYRVHKHRAKIRESETPKKRGEEKRREEKREEQLHCEADASRNGHEALDILSWLNTKTGKHFRPTPTNLDAIKCRLKEGITPGQLRAIVTRKVREWGTDERMKGFLRPATLFNRTKCEQYVGELPAIPSEGQGELPSHD
jgi:uncharacterized phage protein (TIGR02220 family)